MQEVDAARRIAILRGEVPPPLEDEPEQQEVITKLDHQDEFTRVGGRKKRKRQGEDDTEFEMRLAGERNEPRSIELEAPKKTTSSAPITDHRGHIDLFGDEKARAHAEKNDEVESEKKKRKQEQEDKYTMRFSKAAGKDGLGKPWYSQSELVQTGPSKDVWGNDDPSRKERDAQRMVSNDPLAMMKLGASKVREVKAERRKLRAEQQDELRQLEREQREDSRHRRERRSREHRRRSSRSRSRERRHRRESPDRSGHRSRPRRHGDGEHLERRHRGDGRDRRRRDSPERHVESSRRDNDRVESTR